MIPAMRRLGLWPAETLLVVPAPPEEALRGALILRGLARRLGEEAAGYRSAREKAARAAAALEAERTRLAAARAAAQAEEREHQDAAQRKLQGLLRMVLGEHAGSAVYRRTQPGDLLAEVDGVQFAEYGNKLHVFVGATSRERPWTWSAGSYTPVPSLAALGHRLQHALSAAELHREAILHNYAEIPALPDEEPDAPAGDAP